MKKRDFCLKISPHFSAYMRSALKARSPGNRVRIQTELEQYQSSRQTRGDWKKYFVRTCQRRCDSSSSSTIIISVFLVNETNN